MKESQTPPEPISRKRFFDDYWSGLAANGWQAVVLHSWQELPERIDSDVDYAVNGVTPRELLKFLSEFCNERGWRLAQVIEHEPDAFFCTCVQRGGDFKTLALDVTWDYRRLGHLLIPSALLQTHSRVIPGKSFQIPSPGAEAAYILAKAAAKGKDFTAIKPRLIELADEDPEEFAAKLRQAFPDYPAPAARGTGGIGDIEKWFPQAPSFRAVRGGHRYGIPEIGLYLRRILHPTGLWLAFQETPQNAEFMANAVRPLLPLFRRVHRYDRISPIRLPQALTKIIRTSLVLERRAPKTSGESNWRIFVDAESAAAPAEVTCRILDSLAARVERRIGKQRP
jgi:hypothetical protein